MKLDNYLSGYLDRRMSMIISEWQLSTRGDLKDLNQRFTSVQNDLDDLKIFEKETGDQLSNLEERVRRLKERRT